MKRESTAEELKGKYKRVQGGWVCKNCKLKFSTLAGTHIHLGRGSCKKWTGQ